MQQVEYAALKYYNNIISEECLYVGMLFHNLTTGAREFRYISNFTRFQSFDDEIDINFVKLYLQGIKQQVEDNLFNYQAVFSISNFTKIYVNEFRFSDVKVIEVDENENYAENLTKMYLKYDFKKNKRLSSSEEKKYIRRILSSKVSFSASRITGEYAVPVTFDYVIGNIAIKIFNFREKDLSKMLPSVKYWAFSAEEFQKDYSVVFLYDELNGDSTEVEAITKMLKKYAKLFQIQDGLDYILKVAA